MHHRDIDHVHITGSTQSFNAIAFGPGSEGQARRDRGEPLLTKPITGELGGVSPTIVVPGRWSAADLRFQAEHVVTQRLHNNGYNCVASQVLVLSDDWAQKEDFLAAVRAAYGQATARPGYYPGSSDRVAAALAAHDGAERLGERALLADLPCEGAPAFTEEYFGPVLAVTSLPGSGAEFLAARASWGAFPGHDLTDIQSGVGVVHNALLLDGIERTVVRGPFWPFPRALLTRRPALSPRPPWFVTNRSAPGHRAPAHPVRGQARLGEACELFVRSTGPLETGS